MKRGLSESKGWAAHEKGRRGKVASNNPTQERSKWLGHCCDFPQIYRKRRTISPHGEKTLREKKESIDGKFGHSQPQQYLTSLLQKKSFGMYGQTVIAVFLGHNQLCLSLKHEFLEAHNYIHFNNGPPFFVAHPHTFIVLIIKRDYLNLKVSNVLVTGWYFLCLKFSFFSLALNCVQ